jgi:hypothetical protein
VTTLPAAASAAAVSVELPGVLLVIGDDVDDSAQCQYHSFTREQMWFEPQQ